MTGGFIAVHHGGVSGQEIDAGQGRQREFPEY
jgi:hypothetical protein